MRRWLANIILVLLAGLSITSLTGWITVKVGRRISVNLNDGRHAAALSFNQAGVFLAVAQDDGAELNPSSEYFRFLIRPLEFDSISGMDLPESIVFCSTWDNQPFRSTAGFTFAAAKHDGFAGKTVGVPAWLPIVLFGLAPTFVILNRLRSTYRRRKNFCLCCGYDLRESPTRCPECGTSVAKEI